MKFTLYKLYIAILIAMIISLSLYKNKKYNKSKTNDQLSKFKISDNITIPENSNYTKEDLSNAGNWCLYRINSLNIDSNNLFIFQFNLDYIKSNMVVTNTYYPGIHINTLKCFADAWITLNNNPKK